MAFDLQAPCIEHAALNGDSRILDFTNVEFVVVGLFPDHSIFKNKDGTSVPTAEGTLDAACDWFVTHLSDGFIFDSALISAIAVC